MKEDMTIEKLEAKAMKAVVGGDGETTNEGNGTTVATGWEARAGDYRP